MGPYFYAVKKIDGDYAYLVRTDINSDDETMVARALLPQDIDEGTHLKWENLQYFIV